MLGACVFGAAAYMLCGGLNVGSPIGQAAACVPFAMWMTRRSLDRLTWQRTAALAGAAVASFLPVLLTLGALAAFSTPRGRSSTPGRRRSAAGGPSGA